MVQGKTVHSLKQLIKSFAGTDKDFEDLSFDEKTNLRIYIKQSSMNECAFIGKVFYDVLKGKFFAEYYDFGLPSDKCIKILNFSSLQDLYDYLGENIYEDSCFFGLPMSFSDIRSCGVDPDRLNFDSFIDYDISDINLLDALGPDKSNPQYVAEEMRSWYYALPNKIHDFNNFKKIIDSFVALARKFHLARFVAGAFGMLFEKYGDELFEHSLDYVLEKYSDFLISWCPILFSIILLFANERRKELEEFIDKLECSQSLKSECLDFAAHVRRITEYKREVHFEKEKGIYRFVASSPFQDFYIRVGFYFFDFDLLAKFLNNDLSGIDLSSFPIGRNEFSKCIVDSKTIPPLLLSKSVEKVDKEYDGKLFVATLEWLDESGNALCQYRKEFSRFFDFVHFLKGDLSGSDLSLCDGLENLAHLKLINLQGAYMPSEASISLGLPFEPSETNKEQLHHRKASKDEGFSLTSSNYDGAVSVDHLSDTDEYEDEIRVGYVSDIHVSDKFYAKKCKSVGDKMRVAYGMAASLSSSSKYDDIDIIAGDIAAPLEDYKIFLNRLGKQKLEGDVFLVIGNHELLMSEPPMVREACVHEHGKIAKRYGIHMLENSVFYYSPSGKLMELTTDQLVSMSVEELRLITRGSKCIIFGGFGWFFRGDGTDTTTAFRELYKKVALSQKGRNLIVITHLPTSEFLSLEELDPGFVYLHGHTHHQFYLDNGSSRVIADNQIGYYRKKVEFKHFYLSRKSNWFDVYQDGIYEVSIDDYENFYQGLSLRMDLSRSFKCMHLIKRDGAHMFIAENQRGQLRLLNGGRIRVIPQRPLTYYFEKLGVLLENVKLYFGPYFSKQKEISDWIMSFGGDGSIHGCIIDIDFYNHIYLNPIDGTLVPYYATSIIDKHVYRSIKSLISSRCHWLLKSFLKKKDDQPLLPSTKNGRNSPVKRPIYVESTDMYRISNIVKTLQYANNMKLIRFWDDSLVAETSKANGLAIFQKTLLEIEEKK